MLEMQGSQPARRERTTGWLRATRPAVNTAAYIPAGRLYFGRTRGCDEGRARQAWRAVGTDAATPLGVRPPEPATPTGRPDRVDRGPVRHPRRADRGAGRCRFRYMGPRAERAARRTTAQRPQACAGQNRRGRPGWDARRAR